MGFNQQLCNQACWPGLYSCRFSYFYYGTFPSCIFLYFQTPALSSIRVPALLYVHCCQVSFVRVIRQSTMFEYPAPSCFPKWRFTQPCFSVCKLDAPRVVPSLPIGLEPLLAVGLFVYKPALRHNRGCSGLIFKRSSLPNSREGGRAVHSALYPTTSKPLLRPE